MASIESCRICTNRTLVPILDLGTQAYTGFFPETPSSEVPIGRLLLVKCHGEKSCGLVQLADNFSLPLLYGNQYGYRSGLNQSMVRHLQSKVEKILTMASLQSGDTVLDIGSNDGTTLGFYPEHLNLIGVDPTAKKFRPFYKKHIQVVPDFFSRDALSSFVKVGDVRVITSFSMFYDLEDPVSFAQTVSEFLAPNGMWVLEQSYLPTMLAMNSFDTVCHEHLEYYGLRQIEWILKKVGLHIADVEFNDINGGSFSIVACKNPALFQQNSAKIKSILEKEAPLSELATFQIFEKAVLERRSQIRTTLEDLKKSGRRVFGLGASTKGNVILQYCDITPELLPFIGEVNPDKFGHYTPGTLIPIVSEDTLLDQNPDCLFVLPWHFKDYFCSQEKYRRAELLFPLP